jgi:hypothetical protein
MDADDISLPERLSKQVEFMDANPSVGLLASGFRYLYPDHHLKMIDETPSSPREHSFLRWLMCLENPLAHSTIMARKKVLDSAGRYDPGGLYAEDYDLWRRLSLVTRIHKLGEVLLYLRIHDQRVTANHKKEMMEASLRICQIHLSKVIGAKGECQMHLVRQESIYKEFLNFF